MADSSGSIATQATGSSGLTDLTLAVRIDGLPDQEVFLQHGLSIGRNQSNTICVADTDIERIHAQVMRQADGTMLLECTSDHLRLKLADGSDVHSVVLKPGTTFKLGKAVIRCLKRETKPTLVVAQNPWEVRCPRCHGVIADLRHDAKACPHCQIELQFFISHMSQPGPTAGGTDVRPASDFKGWLPRHIGPYAIRAFVAQGGMGIILRGLHKDSDLPAAVKLLKLDSDADPTWRQRFIAEIDTLKTLRHPNVVRLQDHGQDDKLIWLAMDWIEGQPLTKLAGKYRSEGKNFPIDQIRQILSQVVTGLKYLHDKQIIHRDLKPSNILMAQDDLVKMVDFGIARGASGQTSVVTQLTHTGMVAGTESYMSPEQGEGQTITPASDIYSLGVMWYELVTGRRPVGAFAAPHLLRSDCPMSWSNAIAQCLSVDPRARLSLDRINQILSGQASEPPPLPGQRGMAGVGMGTGVIPSPPTSQTAWTPPPPPGGQRFGPPPVAQTGSPLEVLPPPVKSAAPTPPTGITAAPPPTGMAPPPGGSTAAPPTGAPTAQGPSTMANITQTTAKVAKQTGQTIASASRTVYKATSDFFEKHPPSRWLVKCGPVGKWIIDHRGPSIAIGVGVFLILIILFIRACSSDDLPPGPVRRDQNNAADNRNPNVNANQNIPAIRPQVRPEVEAQYQQGARLLNSFRQEDRQRGYQMVAAAAAQGSMPAMNRLAELHGDRTSPSYNRQQQVYWLKQLAALGDIDARQKLYLMGER